jgi:hypothetical protein
LRHKNTLLILVTFELHVIDLQTVIDDKKNA